MSVYGTGDAGVFAEHQLVGPDLNIAIDSAIDGYRTARERCRLGGAAQSNRLACGIEAIGGTAGVKYDVLSGNRHASINGGLGDIDGARRQTDGAAYGAVANR